MGAAADPAAVPAFRSAFPNFRGTTDSAAGQLALQRSPGAAPDRLTPILLLGSHGFGKNICRMACRTSGGASPRSANERHHGWLSARRARLV